MIDGSHPERPSVDALGHGAVRSRAELLAGSLHARICSGKLAPGTNLGTLDGLRAETGYAKATVSEAVRLLRDRGLVEIRPGRGGGLFVARRTPVVRLRQTLLSVDDEPTAVLDAIELRAHLEELVDVGAARCRSQGDISEVRARLAALERASDWESFMRANWALHERIARICPNAMARGVYLGTLGHISATSARLADDKQASELYRTERYAVHVQLVDAIASGDESSVRAAVARHNSSSSPTDSGAGWRDSGHGRVTPPRGNQLVSSKESTRDR